MLDTAAATIRRHGMIPAGSRVIAAVSGGPDSVFLLHVLRELSPRLGFELGGVAHFNHKLRGEASEEDARFVAALAAEFGLPCFLAEQAVAEGNLEQQARRARHEFFHNLIRQGRADRIALGHTRDDQAETVLFRLLRGSGLTGLAGILPVTAEGLIRPLLEVSRSHIRSYLTSRAIAWREDASNRDPRFARNRLRTGLLPQLEREWNPRIVVALAHLADLAYEEERWWAARLPPIASPDVELQAADLRARPVAEARRIVRHAIRAAKGDLHQIEYRHVDAVLHLARAQDGHGSVILPGLRVTRSFDWLRLVPPRLAAQPSVRLLAQGPGVYPAPDGKSLISLELNGSTPPGNPCDTLKAELCWPKWSAGLELRGWSAGDRYRPLGFAREQKLKDLFQKARVPSWRRASWPILSKDGRIVWARQFGVAAEFAAGREPGVRVRIREASADGF